MTSVKNELVGSWKLLSYIELPIDGSDSLFPVGKNPEGILMYSPDEFMSVQIMAQNRPPLVSGDRFAATQEESLAVINTFIAFSGAYQILENRVVSYQIKTSLFPNWAGQTQERIFDFEGDVLYLKSTEPILSNGVMVNSYMTWQKHKKAQYKEAQLERQTDY